MPIESEVTFPQPDLTPNQERVKKQVLKALEPFSPTNKVLVVIEGISGIGKSVVLQHLDKETSQKKFKTVDQTGDIVNFLDVIKADQKCAGAIIALGPQETVYGETNIRYLAKTKGFTVIPVVLPGMDKREMEGYVAKNFSQAVEVNLPKEKVLQYSLGIPLVARQLIERRATEAESIDFVAGYLCENIPKAAIYKGLGVAENFRKEFLHMEIPPLVTTRLVSLIDERTKQFHAEQIKIYLEQTTAIWEHMKADGTEEVPVMPTTEETTQMYILSEKNPPESAPTGAMRQIEILAPNINSEVFEIIQQSLGFHDGHYVNPEMTARGKMFNVVNDRLAMIGFASDGGIFLYSGRRATPAIDDAKKLEERIKAARLTTGETTKGNGLYIKYFDHPWKPTNAIKAGLMVETLLQQLGVFYYAKNTYAGKEYGYIPQKNRLVMPLTEQTQLIRGILDKDGHLGIANELTRRGFDQKVIKEYLAKDPRNRQLLFGIPSKVKFGSLRSTLENKIKQETNADRKDMFESFKEDVEIGDFLGMLRVENKLERLEHEAVEVLSEMMYKSPEDQKIFIEKILDLATDYEVIQKLKRELPRGK